MPSQRRLHAFHFALCIIHFALCTLLFSHVVQAKPPAEPVALTVELSSQSPKGVVGRAMPTVWDVRKFQPGIMEGHFEFRVGLKDVEFYRYTTDDVVLSNDETTLRFLFPPVITEAELEEVEIRLTWIGKSGRIEMPTQRLIAPTSAPRTVMVGIGENRVSSYRTKDWEVRLELLRLEKLGPPRAPHIPPAIQSVVVSWEATNLPSDPFTFAAYDLVALSGEVFAQLRRPQLEALATWVLAGGRLYVEPAGMMETAQIDFLNRLAPPASGPKWDLDRVGKLEWPTVFEPHLVSAAADFGRILLRDPTETNTTPEWQHRLALWQIPEQLPTRFVPWFVTLGTKQGANGQLWPGSRVPDHHLQNARGTTWMAHQQATRLTITERALQSIVAELMPTTVRVIPLRTIIFLLTVLVLLVGPIDWWLLGRLRLRRFTWLTWPAATVLMTALLITLSNSYLQATDRPRSLVLHDLGSDGRVVRSNRFRLEFPRSSRDVLTQLRQSFWMPLRATAESIQQLGQLAPQMKTDAAALPSYQGRVPSRFETRQAVRQWTPHLSRQFMFGDPAAPPPINWEKVPLEKYRNMPLEESRVPESIVNAIRQQLGDKAIVAIFHESGRWSCDLADLWMAPRARTMMSQDYIDPRTGRQRIRQSAQTWETAPTMLSDLIWRLTVPRGGQHNSSTWAEGLFDPHLRDIPLLRPDQRDLRVLAVVVPGEDETVVYRRWIAGPPPPPPPTVPNSGPNIQPPAQFNPAIPPIQRSKLPTGQRLRFQQAGQDVIQ
ncbi:MAG TPA: hypothetical protein VFG20_18785 [Planctomycetaceae bacterium]|nr:hypothetical protein [Planctomycetaceae bacterium]